MSKPLNATPKSPLPSRDFPMPEVDFSTLNYLELTMPESPSVDEAREKFVQSTPDVNNVVDQGYTDGLAPEQLISLIENQAMKENRLLTEEDATVIDMLSVDNPNYSPTMVRYLNNQYKIEQKLAEEIERRFEDASTLSLGIDVIDRYIVRYPFLGAPEALTFRGDRLSKEIQEAALSLDSEEMNAFIDAKISEMDSEGVFADENLMALMELSAAVEAKGDDPDAEVNAVIAGVETAFVVAPALKGLITAGRAVKRARRANTILQKEAALKGEEAAGKTLSDSLKNAVEGADEVADSAPRAINPNTTTTKLESTPDISVSSYVRKERGLAQTILQLVRRGDFGRALTEAEYSKVFNRIRDSYTARVSTRLLNFDIGTDNPNLTLQAVAQVGKKNGSPFANRGSAERALRRMKENGDLDEVTATVSVKERDDGSAYLEFRENISAGQEVDEVDINIEATRGIRRALAQALGSRGQTDDAVNNALALAGEAGGNVVQELIKPYSLKFRGLKASSREALDAAYNNLRDNPDYAHLRREYTRGDMEMLLEQELGRAPNQKEIEAIDALMELEATSWLFDALKIQDRFVRWGGKTIESPYVPDGAIARRVKGKIPDDAAVNSDGKWLVGKNVEKDSDVWELAEPIVLDDGTELKYIHNPRDVREVAPEDALGFNSGGRRVMPNARNFVGVTTKSGHDKVFMAARTEQQAARAVEELQNIFKAIRDAGGPKVVQGTNLIDDVIAKNNSWDPDIETTSDFFENFVIKQDVDLEGTLFSKERGMPSPSSQNGLQFNNYADFVKHSRRRSDAPIAQYGGGGVHDANAIDSILGGASVSSHQMVNSAWNVRSINSWVRKAVKLAERGQVNFHGANPDDVMNAFREAEVLGNSELAREMRNLQTIIKRRMMQPPEFEAKFRKWGDKMAEYVLDKTGFDTSRVTDNLTNNILSFNFHTTLGLFNLDQVALQASHALQVIAMDPRDGFRASAVIPMMRASFQAPNSAVARGMRDRLAKFVGMSAEDMEELATFVQRSGRNLITSDAVEHGTQYQIRGTGYWGEGTKLDKAARASSRALDQIKDWGLTPFREGEKMSRYTSLTTAWMQYKRMNPTKGSSLTEEGRRWIMNKDGALSFNMTTTQRGALQSGMLRIPTQWLSYTLRSMEAVAFGRGLSPGERARLAVGQGLFFGAVGYGPYAALGLDEIVAENFPNEVGGMAHKIMKRGVLDLVMSTVTTEDTAASERFSPLFGAFELYDRVWNENTLPETLLGPTYSIPGDALVNMVDAVGHFMSNRPTLVTEELMDTFRTIKSVDNSIKAYSIMMTGGYHSKGGGPSRVNNLSSVDAINLLLGFKPVGLAAVSEVSRVKFKYNERMREFESELKPRVDRAFDLMISGDANDRAYGSKLLKETADVINAMAYFTAEDRVQLKRRLFSGPKSRPLKAFKDALELSPANAVILEQEANQ